MNTKDIENFKWYSGNLDWLQVSTIALSKAGSQSYGTDLPGSDLDIRGVAIAPMRCYLGFMENFEQSETRTPIDCNIYDIRKFFKLAADANPNVLAQLWVDPSDVYICRSAWDTVLEHRDMFLSKKVRHTFSGYAISQLRRIRTHRRWLLDPPKAPPERSSYGLPPGEPTLGKEQLGVIWARMTKNRDRLASEGLRPAHPDDCEDFLVAEAVMYAGFNSNLIPLIISERNFGAAVKTWSQYQTWKQERNPVRQAMEAQYGYDTKHGMHLVRLLRMGDEILRGDGVIVKRPDAEELLSIRAGAWSFERLEEYALAMDAQLGRTASDSNLPHSPDRTWLNDVLVRTILADSCLS